GSGARMPRPPGRRSSDRPSDMPLSHCAKFTTAPTSKNALAQWSYDPKVTQLWTLRRAAGTTAPNLARWRSGGAVVWRTNRGPRLSDQIGFSGQEHASSLTKSSSHQADTAP